MNEQLARLMHSALNNWMARRAPTSNYERREWDDLSGFERELFFYLAENARAFFEAGQPKQLPPGDKVSLHNDLFGYIFGTDSREKVK